jgi:hypothetical protein
VDCTSFVRQGWVPSCGWVDLVFSAFQVPQKVILRVFNKQEGDLYGKNDKTVHVVEVEFSLQRGTLGPSRNGRRRSQLSLHGPVGSSSLIETATAAATCLEQTFKFTLLLPSTLLSSTNLHRTHPPIQTLANMAGDPRALLRQVGRTLESQPPGRSLISR